MPVTIFHWGYILNFGAEMGVDFPEAFPSTTLVPWKVANRYGAT